MFILTVYTAETGYGNFSKQFDNNTDLQDLVTQIRTLAENHGEPAFLEWPADPETPTMRHFLDCSKVVSYTITTEPGKA